MQLSSLRFSGGLFSRPGTRPAPANQPAPQADPPAANQGDQVVLGNRHRQRRNALALTQAQQADLRAAIQDEAEEKNFEG